EPLVAVGASKLDDDDVAAPGVFVADVAPFPPVREIVPLSVVTDVVFPFEPLPEPAPPPAPPPPPAVIVTLTLVTPVGAVQEYGDPVGVNITTLVAPIFPTLHFFLAKLAALSSQRTMSLGTGLVFSVIALSSPAVVLEIFPPVSVSTYVLVAFWVATFESELAVRDVFVSVVSVAAVPINVPLR